MSQPRSDVTLVGPTRAPPPVGWDIVRVESCPTTGLLVLYPSHRMSYPPITSHIYRPLPTHVHRHLPVILHFPIHIHLHILYTSLSLSLSFSLSLPIALALALSISSPYHLPIISNLPLHLPLISIA